MWELAGVCARTVINSSRGRVCVQRASVKQHKLCEKVHGTCVVPFSDMTSLGAFDSCPGASYVGLEA